MGQTSSALRVCLPPQVSADGERTLETLRKVAYASKMADLMAGYVVGVVAIKSHMTLMLSGVRGRAGEGT